LTATNAAALPATGSIDRPARRLAAPLWVGALLIVLAFLVVYPLAMLVFGALSDSNPVAAFHPSVARFGVWAQGSKGKVGHCMMIIGYDNSLGPNGSILIQNSFGTTWGSQWNGSGGYVWMDCSTFQATMQGTGIYITQMASPSKR
jgi:hypothetical protein